MNILARAWKAIRNPMRIFYKPFLSSRVGSLFGGGTEQAKARGLIKHYRHWVYTCSSRNSTSVAATPLRLYVRTNVENVERGKQYRYLRRGRDTRSVDRKTLRFLNSQAWLTPSLGKVIEVEEVVEHPFLDLWINVNTEDEGFTMLEKLQLFLELTGNAYLYVLKDELGIPRELYVLYSQYVTIIPNEDGSIKGYIYQVSPNRQEAFTANEIIHFKFPSPHDPYYGFSPLQGCLMAVSRKEEMDDYEASILHNFGRPDFVIKIKGRLSDPDARSLAERWKQIYGMRKKRGKPAILDQDADVIKLGWGPKEMAFLKGHKYTKEEIAGAYGVPVSKLTSEDVNRANADAGDYSWMKDTILPRLRRLAEKLSQKLMPMFDNRLFVMFDNPVPADKEFELKKQEVYLKNGVMSINQVRQQIGEEPVSWGETPIMPLTMMPLGVGSPFTEEETTPSVPSTEEEDEEEEGKHKKDRPEFIRLPRPEFSKMRSIMQKIYQQISIQIRQQVQAGQGTPERSWFYFDTNKWEKIVKRKMGEPIKKALISGAAHGIARIPRERDIAGLITAKLVEKGILTKQFGFDINNPEVQRWLRGYVAHFASITTKDLGLAFSRKMAAGLREEETLRQLIDRVGTFFKGMEKTKAMEIARSESSRALHHGMEYAWQQAEVVKGKEWLCNPG